MKTDVIATVVVVVVAVLDGSVPVMVVDDTAIIVVPLLSLLSSMFCGGRSQFVCCRTHANRDKQ